MSSRKSRLSLSKDFHKDKDVKTPNTKRTSARTSARTSLAWKSPDSQRNGESCEVSPSQGSDNSPLVPLTQDSSFHAINGVSWEWNSPQRLRDQPGVAQPVAIKAYNHKPPLRPKYKDIPVTVPKKPSGFNKFISKLNLLMEKENLAEQANAPETDETHEQHEQQLETNQSDLLRDSCFTDEFFVEDDTQLNVAITNSGESDDDIFQGHIIETPEKKCSTTATGGELLDDSKLDNLLIEASQTIEQKLYHPIPVPPAASPSPPPAPIPVETKKFQSNISIPIEMNDSDMDGFLIQASLMVEEKLSDSSQESTSHGNNADVQKTVSKSESGAVSATCAAPSNSYTEKNGTSEITMSQEELKALIETKRQEALRRLQNNRLKRGIKGPPPYHG